MELEAPTLFAPYQPEAKAEVSGPQALGPEAPKTSVQPWAFDGNCRPFLLLYSLGWRTALTRLVFPLVAVGDVGGLWFTFLPTEEAL